LSLLHVDAFVSNLFAGLPLAASATSERSSSTLRSSGLASELEPGARDDRPRPVPTWLWSTERETVELGART